MKTALEIFGFVLCAVLGQAFGYTVSIGEGGKLQIPRAEFLSREDEAAILDLWNKLSESRQNIDNDRSLYRTDSPSEATTRLPSPEDSWSIVWYIASFSGLIAFFLIVSCSEWCCRKHVRVSSAPPPRSGPPTASASAQTSVVQETPPPAYDLFAPPSYESLAAATAAAAASSATPIGEKGEFDVYVVPVHAIGSVLGEREGRPDDPPSYSAVNLSYVSETSA